VKLAPKWDLKVMFQPVGRPGRRARASGTPGSGVRTQNASVDAGSGKSGTQVLGVWDAGPGRLGRRDCLVLPHFDLNVNPKCHELG
jgi:hypothetical protein